VKITNLMFGPRFNVLSTVKVVEPEILGGGTVATIAIVPRAALTRTPVKTTAGPMKVVE
jgi:hypothetical protein